MLYVLLELTGYVEYNVFELLFASLFIFIIYGYIPKSSVTVVCRGSDSSSNITNNQNTENTIGQPTGKGDNEPTLYYLANSQSIPILNASNDNDSPVVPAI